MAGRYADPYLEPGGQDLAAAPAAAADEPADEGPAHRGTAVGEDLLRGNAEPLAGRRAPLRAAPAAVLASASALAAVLASAPVLGPAAVLARSSASASAEQRIRPGESGESGESGEPGEPGDLAAADPAEERGRAGGPPPLPEAGPTD